MGKTHLTHQLTALLDEAEDCGQALMLEEFSHRTSTAETLDLGSALLGVLKTAAYPGDRFLRGGYPGSETLLLLAVKMHDFEISRPALAEGGIVLEGRSLLCTAVTQALLEHDDDGQALHAARELFELAGRWRPQPDLTIVIADSVEASISRMETRDGYSCSTDEKQLHQRAQNLYERFAADLPDQLRTLDRRQVGEAEAPALMLRWIQERRDAATGTYGQATRSTGSSRGGDQV